MAFKGQDSLRTKIVIGKIIEQVKLFNYLGNTVSYEKSWALTKNYNTI
jgi:hypothetical protein